MTRLAELRALLAKATPGPFYADDAISGDGYVVMSESHGIRVAHFHATATATRMLNQEGNSKLVAAAVNALPALLDVAEVLAAQRPPIYDGMYCMLCHKHTDDESDGWEMKPESHVTSCPWLLARELGSKMSVR